MVTHYPQMTSSETLNLVGHAHESDAGIGARALGWLRQAYCGLHGHDSLMQFEQERMYLQCVSCGHATPGWELTQPRPVVSARLERRAMRPRPRLVVRERRVA